MSSSAVGYSVSSGGVKEGVVLVPLLERLVQLVERRGTEGLAIDEGEIEEQSPEHQSVIKCKSIIIMEYSFFLCLQCRLYLIK